MIGSEKKMASNFWPKIITLQDFVHVLLSKSPKNREDLLSFDLGQLDLKAWRIDI